MARIEEAVDKVRRETCCGCKSRKPCFLSYDRARATIRKHRGRRKLSRRPRCYVRVYRCKSCRHWHVGTSNKTLDGRRNPFKKFLVRYEHDLARWKENLDRVDRIIDGERLQNLQPPAETGD